VTFAGHPEVVAALESNLDEDAGTVDRARAAIQDLKFTEDSTSFLSALQLAQDLLLPQGAIEAESEKRPERLVLHLIGDFQLTGMPLDTGGWRLSSEIELEPVVIGKPIDDNVAVVDLGVRKLAGGEIRVQGKVKNWSSEKERDVVARLFVGEEERLRQQIAIKPRSASQVSFRIADSGEEMLEGRIEIGPDGLDVDNRRYFIWNAPRSKRVLLIADDKSAEQQWPAGWFLASVLETAEDDVWGIAAVDRAGLADHLESVNELPDLILAGDLADVDEATADRLLTFARRGGPVMLMLNDALTSERLNGVLLEPLGLRSLGFRHLDPPRQSRFELLSWIDFEHPIFAPFQGSKFNDFSPVRFYNYHLLEIVEPKSPASSIARRVGAPTGDDDPEDKAPRATVVARFEGDGAGEGPPAIVEVRLGGARVLVCAFSSDLYWTNLPKQPKFLPLMDEALAHMTGAELDRRRWRVGERYTNLPIPSGNAGSWWVMAPGETEPSRVGAKELMAARDEPVARAGFFRWRGAEKESWEQIDAINIDPEESNPERVTVDEFKLKLAAAPVVDDRPGGDRREDRRKAAAGLGLRSEFWRVVLGLLLVFLIFESWYASRLLR
jgi:hypothetical protein